MFCLLSYHARFDFYNKWCKIIKEYALILERGNRRMKLKQIFAALMTLNFKKQRENMYEKFFK